ncbi:unnamed protein product [Clonostachys rosea f. rosea IK726]|uniref:Uncharacterized protein n=1 Tax=Clonostachys rosea f. rosea IK726 TaxID=1349383 RepID=A0ACA9UMC8_BIOOC|nr:unnamed protein product [Clonostachys rosea f. rosea IK726]
MDWMPADPTFLPNDWRIFGYKEEGAQDARAIRKLQKDETPVVDVLSTEESWERWFSNAIGISPLDKEREGVHLLLCSRAPEVFEGDPSPPSYLPFTLPIWELLVPSWHVHRGITRVISRRVACFSATKYLNCSEQLEFSYLARMSAGLPDDLALSTTYIPATKSQFCIVYGCNKSQMQKIQRRISLAGDGLHHPLTTVGIFAEIERERLVNAVDDLVDQFSLRAEVLDMKYWNTDIPVDNRKTRENLAICLRSRELADQIRSTKRQISKFISHIDRFNEWMTGINSEGANNTSDVKETMKLREIGERIKGRLQDILHEYDDKIDECKMMSESLSLIMQTQWNQIAQKDSTTNTKIARVNNMIAIETKTESIQMNFKSMEADNLV